MIETIMALGSASVVGPMCVRVMWRVYGFKRAIDRGHDRHLFEPHIRRDITGKWETKICDVCRQGPKAWIHKDRPSSDAAEGNYTSSAKILELETDDIKWRFEHDPEWVKVFGEEYDPKTFREIPKFHNGECGGPNDSCERCAWEADQEDERREKQHLEWKKEDAAKKRHSEEAERNLMREELKAYEDILWTLWNTCHSPDEALEEFRDLEDEIGMLKNSLLRKKIKSLDVFVQVHWCLRDSGKIWKRREEDWEKRRVELERRRHSRYTPYDYY